MKNVKMASLTLALLAVTGCKSLGFENKRLDYKAEAGSTAALEIPPDLSRPASEGNYVIQGAQGETVASYSDFAKGNQPGAVAPSGAECKPDAVAGAGNSSHLSPSRVQMASEGAKRWLVVKTSATELWPSLKSFWGELNIKLASEEVKSGLMETEWVDSHAKIEESGIRGAFGKLSAGMYVLPNRDMFRLRVEPSSDGGSAIYLTHYGKEEVVDVGGNGYKWQNRPSDAELEAALLQQLMSRLSAAAPQAVQVEASTQQAAAAGAVELVEQTTGGKAIQIGEPIEQSWRRVGAALEKGKQNIEDKNRTEGIYYVNTVKADQQMLYSFLGGGSSKPEHLHVRLREANGVTLVSVTYDDGSRGKSADRLLDKLYELMK